MKEYRAMIITDLDGTLLNSEREVSVKNLDVLNKLEKMGIMRVAATGRNLYSARKVMGRDFPVDFLVFSSGAGVARWNPFELLMSSSLTPSDVIEIATLFIEYQFDFMIHDEIPDNHIFYYFSTGKDNPDFWNRINIYGEFAKPISKEDIFNFSKRATEVVGIGCTIEHYRSVQSRLGRFSVIRATSPLDLKTIWVEVFPDGISKASGSEFIRNIYSIPREKVMAVGNDYNDMALLEWAGHSFVVENAPQELRKKYVTVETNEKDGFSKAVQKWLKMIDIY